MYKCAMENGHPHPGVSTLVSPTSPSTPPPRRRRKRVDELIDEPTEADLLMYQTSENYKIASKNKVLIEQIRYKYLSLFIKAGMAVFLYTQFVHPHKEKIQKITGDFLEERITNNNRVEVCEDAFELRSYGDLATWEELKKGNESDASFSFHLDEGFEGWICTVHCERSQDEAMVYVSEIIFNNKDGFVVECKKDEFKLISSSFIKAMEKSE